MRGARAWRAAFLVALLAAISPLAAAAEAGIDERADVTSLGRVRTRVLFRLPDERTPERVSLEAACKRLGRAASCVSSAVVGGGRAEVSFNVEAPHDVSVAALEGAKDAAPSRLVLLSRVRPLQFSLGGGFGAAGRAFSVRYPTHTAVLEPPKDAVVEATVPLDLSSAGALGIPLPSSAEAGELVLVPALNGSLCVAALLDGAGVAAQQASPGCGALLLPTAGLDPSHELRLLAAAIDPSGVRLAVRPLSLRASGPALPLRLDRALVVAGEGFVADLGVAAESCTVTLEDPLGAVADRLELAGCERVAVGTSSGMAPGTYVVRVSALVGGRRASAAATISVLPGAAAGAVVRTEGRSFLPGESVRLHVETQGDWCTAAVYTAEGVKVSEEATFGCASLELPLDDALPPGPYLVRTEVYEGGVLAAVATTPIAVAAWRPPPRSSRRELCERGFLAVDELLIPCIAEGDACAPASQAAPLCLCFSGDEPVDACPHGATCGAGGCGARRLSDPYVIAREPGGHCTARRGADSLPCAEVGEVCAGRCLCLDGGGSPVATCAAGEGCLPDGCRAPRLELRVRQPPAGHVRAEELAEGVALEWKGSAVFDGSPLEEEGALTGRAFLGQLQSSALEASFDGTWTVTARFTGELPPGLHELALMVEHAGYAHLVRAPFEVWHPVAESGLVLFAEGLSPERLSVPELAAGATVELGARVHDMAGRSLAYLPQRAFSLSAAGVEADAVAATFDGVSGVWTVVGTVRGAPSGEDAAVLSVDHLGRSGTVRVPLPVAERAPLEVRILRVEPGSEDAPLFHVLAGLGFGLDLYLRVRGAQSLSKESLDVRLGERRLGAEGISYIMETVDGVRVHLPGVRLCPPPPQGTLVPLVVTVTDGAASARDSTAVLVRSNPGAWDNVGEVGCR